MLGSLSSLGMPPSLCYVHQFGPHLVGGILLDIDIVGDIGVLLRWRASG